MQKPTNLSNVSRCARGAITIAANPAMAAGAQSGGADPEGPRIRGCKPGDLVLVAKPDPTSGSALPPGIVLTGAVASAGANGETIVLVEATNTRDVAQNVPQFVAKYTVCPQ